MQKQTLRLLLAAPALFAAALVFMACPPATDSEPPVEGWAIVVASDGVVYDAHLGVLVIKSTSFTTATALADITKVKLGTQALAEGDTADFSTTGEVTIQLVTTKKEAISALPGFADNGVTSALEGLTIDAGFAVRKRGLINNALAATPVKIGGSTAALTSAAIDTVQGTIEGKEILVSIENTAQAGALVLTLGKSAAQTVTPGAVTSPGVPGGVQTDDIPVVDNTTTPTSALVTIDNGSAAETGTYTIEFPLTVTEADTIKRTYTVTITINAAT